MIALKPSGITLATLFEAFYVPETGLAKGSYRTKFRTCLKWFASYLHRDPTAADLNPTTLAAFFRYCLAHGQSPASVKTYRVRLGTLTRFAIAKQIIAGPVEIPAVGGKYVPRERRRGLAKLGTVQHYFVYTFAPSNLDVSTSRLASYHAALNRFDEFIGGGQASLDDLTPTSIIEFQEWLEARNTARPTALRYAGHLRLILRASEAVHDPTGDSIESDPNEPSPEGSLTACLYGDYSLERPMGDKCRAQMLYAIRSFREFLGRVPMLTDLDKGTLNRFILWIQNEKRYRPATIRGRRRSLLTLWNWAFDNELVDKPPRGIRKVQVPIEVTAWTPEEVAAIIRAADAIPKKQTVALTGVSWRLFLRSLILAAWDSALRPCDLMRLTMDDFTVDDAGEGRGAIVQAKTRRPVAFRFSAETVQAISDCVASGRGEWSGRSRIWGGLIQWNHLTKRFAQVMRAAVVANGITPGPFKWLRRASITAREATAQGLGTMAAGHASGQVTQRHYIDLRQIPAPPLPPSVVEGD